MRDIGTVKRDAGGCLLTASGNQIGMIVPRHGTRGFSLAMNGVYWRHGVPNTDRGGNNSLDVPTVKEGLSIAREALALVDTVRELREEVKRLKATAKAVKKELKDPKKAAQDVRVAYGLPPYDGPNNPCRGDGIFHAAFEREHGMTVGEAARLLGLDKVYDDYQRDLENVRRRHS